MAIAEGFTNAVRHAHGTKYQDCPITIKLTLTPETVEIRIWDYSQTPFDIQTYLSKTTCAQNKEASGGRGLLILSKIADHLSYSYDPLRKQNCLLIVKSLATPLL